MTAAGTAVWRQFAVRPPVAETTRRWSVFGISGFELLIVIAFVLIIFGPDKLPELGRTVGRAMGMFKRAQEDMERVIRAEMYTRDSAEKKGQAQSSSTEEEPDEAAPAPAAKLSTAATIWASTDEDDEEEDEE